MEHTPGPWKVHHDMKDCVTFEGNYGEENLFTQNTDDYYACQNSADANLISAAPELLAALENMNKLMNEILPQADNLVFQNYGLLNTTLMDTDAAIKKAKGEEA